ncbi:MAG: BREX-3 system phosphatase PglZ [Candidatus Riflebacteria bacterium]|nr:BREX-3 system phosphatase PglZ [Candidatus Riflebacteria bacterium]
MLSFSQYLYETNNAEQNKRIIFIDEENLEEKFSISDYFKKQGYDVYYSSKTPFVFVKATSTNCKAKLCSPLSHRSHREQPPQSLASPNPAPPPFVGELQESADKQILLIVRSDGDIPNEIRDICVVKRINIEEIFPELNAKAIKEKIHNKNQLDLLCSIVYEYCPYNLNYSDTLKFIEQKVFTDENIYIFVKSKTFELVFKSKEANSPFDWFEILNEKSELELIALRFRLLTAISPLSQPIGCQLPQNETFGELHKSINKHFKEYILNNYFKLHNYTTSKSPILVNKVLDYIHSKSKKFALIVMDGMSLLNWKAISQKLNNFKYKESFAFAMLPTITSISRQSLLSGKFPKYLNKPFDLSQEEKGFKKYASEELNYKDYEVEYISNQQFISENIDNLINLKTKCVAIIINDIDDLVHESRNSKILLNSIKELGIAEKLENYIKELQNKGFDVYITADHGNTQCYGVGRYTQNGVQTTSRSKRMIIQKNYADKNELVEKFDMIEIPNDYLPVGYDYLVCNSNNALDSNGSELMSHGGITLDEVIVPFIALRIEN